MAASGHSHNGQVAPAQANGGKVGRDGGLALTPVTSHLCNLCSAACIVSGALTHCFYDYHETRPAVRDEDPWVPRLMTLTAIMAGTGFVYELCIAVSIKVMGVQELYEQDLGARRRLRLNRKMLFVFAFLSTTYSLMAADMQWVHKGWLAEYHGGHQIIYSVRYIEWTFCAPIVLSVSGQLEHAPDGTPRNALLPSSVLTGVYCAIAWQGLVVKDFWAGWGLIVLAFVGYFLASVEQLAFVWHIKDQGRAGPLRAGLLTYLVIMIGIYGVVYLLPIPGWISPYAENKFYCLGDISFKLLTSIMLIASNDIAYNDELRRSAEASVHDLRRLIHSASVPIFGVDVRGCVDQVNTKLTKLTGLTEEQALGRPLLPMLGRGPQNAQAVLRRALDGVEDPGTLETTFLPEDVDGAKQAMLNLSATPRKDKNGVVTGVTFVGCDLTDVSAYREAEERKVRFLGVVSHELRSPLHGIIGLMGHLQDSEEDPKKKRFLKMVENCASRLLDLVVNIMEMASMATKTPNQQSQQKALSRDPVELSSILDEIVVLVRNSMDKSGKPLIKKGVELVNELGPLPIIEADAHKCTQVFYNIVTNACKFTMKGSVTLSSHVDPDGQWVEVSVRDSGTGIAPESLDRIFQPFEQEDSSLARGYQGIGLGLSIAQEVVRRHGGRIAVASEVDVGSTFTVRLPTSMGQPAPQAAEVSENGGEAPAPPKSTALDAPEARPDVITEDTPIERRQVLLSVDDDPVNQEVIKSALSGHYEVHLAMDGSEALEYLRECASLPDLMLLDVMMPMMSGFQVCRTVRSKLKISATELPILMCSATAMGESIIEGFDSGCNDYVTKPFDKKVLLAHVHAAARLKRQYVADLERARQAAPAIPSSPDSHEAGGEACRRRRLS